MTSTFTRRSATGCFWAARLRLPCRLRAQERYLDVRPGGQFRPIMIAVTNFAGDPDAGHALSDIITNNFSRSVFLQPIDPKSFVDRPTNPDQPPQMDAWRVVNAQFVVTGRGQRAGDGRLKSEFRLWDVATGQQVAGQQYVTDPNNSRRVAHIISDAIFTRITGEKGFFDTRVVFIDETGPKERRRKRLAIMDQDGQNVRYLTRGDESGGDAALLTVIAGRDLHVLRSGRSARLPAQHRERPARSRRQFSRHDVSPRFSPDGQRIVMSLTQGTSSNLYVMDLARATRRGSPTRRPSTPRRPTRRMARASCSNPIAAARSRFM